MATATRRKNFTVTVIPLCAPDKILVSVHCKDIMPSDWETIAGSAAMQDEHLSVRGDGFIGIVIAVGREMRDRGFASGDAITGYVCVGSWVDGDNQAYLSMEPDNLWHLSPETAKKFQVVTPAAGSGCIIL